MGQPVLSTARRAEPCVVTLIEQQAELRGSQAALIGSDRSLTFDELNRAANRLAFTLQEMLGLATGFVAVCLPPCVDRIIAVLSILKSGRGYVVIDPRLHDQGLRDLVGHADVRCVVTNPILASRFDAELPTLDIAQCHLFGRDDNPGICAGPDAPAYLRYTSGSTGAPKGVLHNNRAALGQGLAFVETVQLQPGDRLCCFMFFPHAVILGTLMTGAALHIVDAMSEGLRAIAGRLRRDRVSVLSCFPSMLRSLSVTLLPGGHLADLRRITLSGEPVTARDINLAVRLMPEGGMATNNYGSSEFVQIASHSVRGALPDSAVVPTGRPPSGVEVRLVNADGDPVAIGEIGEITVRAPFMSSGYWKRPDLTQKIFGSATPQDGTTYYHTGDVGRIDSTGLLTVLGRVDNQIKLRAHRITPEEIEHVLLRHPTIDAVAVRSFSDELGVSFLVAYLVAAPDAVVEPAVLRAFARTHLPKYMIPSVFIPIEALPQTVGGKLDRSALPDPLAPSRASQRR